MCVHLHVCTYVHTYILERPRACVRACVLARICKQTCTHARTHTETRTRTHTHTPLLAQRLFYNGDDERSLTSHCKQKAFRYSDTFAVPCWHRGCDCRSCSTASLMTSALIAARARHLPHGVTSTHFPHNNYSLALPVRRPERSRPDKRVHRPEHQRPEHWAIGFRFRQQLSHHC